MGECAWIRCKYNTSKHTYMFTNCTFAQIKLSNHKQENPSRRPLGGGAVNYTFMQIWQVESREMWGRRGKALAENKGEFNGYTLDITRSYVTINYTSWFTVDIHQVSQQLLYLYIVTTLSARSCILIILLKAIKCIPDFTLFYFRVFFPL